MNRILAGLMIIVILITVFLSDTTAHAQENNPPHNIYLPMLITPTIKYNEQQRSYYNYLQSLADDQDYLNDWITHLPVNDRQTIIDSAKYIIDYGMAHDLFTRPNPTTPAPMENVLTTLTDTGVIDLSYVNLTEESDLWLELDTLRVYGTMIDMPYWTK